LVQAALRVYIAGRIKGVANYAPPFTEAADNLRSQGFDVFNPAAANQEGRPINKIMGYLLPQLCNCDAIAMLPSWWRSGGARIEWMLARYLGLKVIYL
jgi:hypothetical protein